MIVAPVRTTITLALSFKISDKVDGSKGKEDKSANTCSINVHVDMSAINIFAQRVSGAFVKPI